LAGSGSRTCGSTPHRIGPLRLNAWVSLLIFAFGIWFWWLGRHEPRQRQPGHDASAANVGN
jgi:hypothetical protein